jgi:transcriptional regulator with XRE-family HTH domain
MEKIAKILKAAREKRGLGLREASRLCGVPVSTLSKLEAGTLMNPTLVTIVMMQKAYGVKLKDWVDSIDQEKKS